MQRPQVEAAAHVSRSPLQKCILLGAAQSVNVTHAIQVSSVQIQVVETFPGGTPPDVAITELELFALPWQPKP